MKPVRIVSVRQEPEYAGEAIKYIQQCWPEVLPVIYEDCIRHSLQAKAPLPQWYLLMDNQRPIGCCGLITNDFISRSDLYPWICAVYIDEEHRGRAYSALLLDRCKQDCAALGFDHVYLSTDHIGFYEKYGFEYIGQGYHPWGEESRIYSAKV
ncbi:GNAT family N-acetyltransferase [Deltaproteobacteria bacterium Smac51]|nr:GNAT family N-acetyltransferase [Deltaproteobacteria bacterium Smac51]